MLSSVPVTDSQYSIYMTSVQWKCISLTDTTTLNLISITKMSIHYKLSPFNTVVQYLFLDSIQEEFNSFGKQNA